MWKQNFDLPTVNNIISKIKIVFVVVDGQIVTDGEQIGRERRKTVNQLGHTNE